MEKIMRIRDLERRQKRELKRVIHERYERENSPEVKRIRYEQSMRRFGMGETIYLSST